MCGPFIDKTSGAFLLMLLFVSSFPLRGIANNNYFIPGDAFYYFEISQAEWDEFKKGSLSTWAYDRPDHLPLMLCGYAGYRNMDVSDLPNDYRKRFIEAVERMKKQFPTRVEKIQEDGLFNQKVRRSIEKNQIRIFVYNKEFDFTKHRIGLKYNETWPEMGPRLGHAKEHFQFDFFVNTPKAIAESWRMGSNVKGLQVELPAVHRGVIQTPIRFNPNELKFLIAPPNSIESICYPGRKAKDICFEVTNSKLRKLVVDKHRWKMAEF
ncbi:MAG: hypothetical protein AAGA30_17530 [Planctomycetota bacterium]